MQPVNLNCHESRTYVAYQQCCQYVTGDLQPPVEVGHPSRRVEENCKEWLQQWKNTITEVQQ